MKNTNEKSSNDWKYLFQKRLMRFAVNIVLLTNKFPKTPAGFAIASQLVKAGTSIGANFTEAQDASSVKDFIQKLSISLREARETYYWLVIVKDAKILPESEMESDLDEADELIAILITSIKKAKSKVV